jgi:dTDP-4-dehydrorhamnose 3,5-epimerase
MSSPFRSGTIDGAILRPLQKFADARGWLCEVFRDDEIPAEFHPVMAYISMTEPGVARGPHEHAHQADYFAFVGPSNFKLYLWDNRPGSKTYRVAQTILVGQDHPTAVIIPKGVVHAYKNVGDVQGWVFNCPNQLYRGAGKKQPVDEIRHEDDRDSPFKLD